MIRISQIVIFTLLYIGVGSGAIAQPTLTHVDNVNAAGNATLYWDLFMPVGTEEFVHNEIKVFDLAGGLLSPSPHIIGPDLTTGQLPTGWVMPSILYNADDYACCYAAVQVTTNDGGVTNDPSLSSPFLCTIHLGASEGPGGIDLVWNSPHALSGIAAGGDFNVEKLNATTAVWDVIAIIPDNINGGTYTDDPGPCNNLHIYRIRQTAPNGVDTNVSNATDLITGTGNNDSPVTTHVDVDPATGLAVVHFNYNVTPETLGYIIYMCTSAGAAQILQIGDPNATSASIPTSLASVGVEEYRVAAFDCINDDGTPNPNAAGECTSSIYTTATQIPCTDRAQVSWNEPWGIDGGVEEYLIQARLFDAGSGSWGVWGTIGSLTAGFGTFIHEGADVASTYEYRVIAISTTANVAHSNSYELEFTYPDAPEPPSIIRASVLNSGEVEIVVWTDPLAVDINLYQLERLDGYDNSWGPILAPLSSTLGFPLTFVDTSVNTDSKSYTYRCSVYNECGAAVATSNIGKTILLQGWSSDEPEAYLNNLIWSQYEEFPTGVGSYELIRANTRTEVATPLSSQSSSQFFAEDYVGDLTYLPGDFCYTIIAIANNPEDGVQGSVSNKVCLSEDPLIWIPTAFTPNDDGLNDYFPWDMGGSSLGFVTEGVDGGEPVFRMSIVSRWGDTIFESENVNSCWDGTSNGNDVPDGVYSAVIRVLDGSGKWHTVSQAIQVLRP
jgi:gliding motility-associated-like protein